MTGWMQHKLESILLGKISNNLRCTDNTALMAESEELKSFLMKLKEESEKVGLKFNMRKISYDLTYMCNLKKYK